MVVLVAQLEIGTAHTHARVAAGRLEDGPCTQRGEAEGGLCARAAPGFRSAGRRSQHDGHLGACDHQDEHHEGEEAEDVVEALQPDGGHDEEQLDEDRAEG